MKLTEIILLVVGTRFILVQDAENLNAITVLEFYKCKTLLAKRMWNNSLRGEREARGKGRPPFPRYSRFAFANSRVKCAKNIACPAG